MALDVRGIQRQTISVSSESYVDYRDARHAVNLMQKSGNDPVHVPTDKVRR